MSAFLKDHFIKCVPAQMRTGDTWYQGTADAIYQNLNLDPRVARRTSSASSAATTSTRWTSAR